MASVSKKTASKPKASGVVAANTKENVVRGTLFSLGSIVVGVVLWVILWRMGFIASIAAFAIAWTAIKLYGLGAGTVTRNSAPFIVAVSVVGVVLAFLASIVSDGLDFVHEEMHIPYWEALTTADFWRAIWESMQTSELWASYRNDILMSAVFAALGMFWTLKDLFIVAQPAVAEKPAPKKTA